jgi:hypothetical protein
VDFCIVSAILGLRREWPKPGQLIGLGWSESPGRIDRFDEGRLAKTG